MTESVSYEEAVAIAAAAAAELGWGKEVYRYGGCAMLGYGNLIIAGLLGEVEVMVESEYDDDQPTMRYFCFPTGNGPEYRAKIEALLAEERIKDATGRTVKVAPDIERILREEWAQA
ncbi:MAG: hypothetical protein ABIJ72_03535 [bacterium]